MENAVEVTNNLDVQKRPIGKGIEELEYGDVFEWINSSVSVGVILGPHVRLSVDKGSGHVHWFHCVDQRSTWTLPDSCCRVRKIGRVRFVLESDE